MVKEPNVVYFSVSKSKKLIFHQKIVFNLKELYDVKEKVKINHNRFLYPRLLYNNYKLKLKITDSFENILQ